MRLVAWQEFGLIYDVNHFIRTNIEAPQFGNINIG